MKIFLRLLPSAGLLLLLAGCDIEDFAQSARFKSDFHYNFDVKPGCRLSVETLNGSVEVTTWDSDKIEVNGTKYAGSQRLVDQIKIDAQGGMDSVSLRTVTPVGHHGGNMGASYMIHVPRKVTLDRITSSNGGIRVDGVQGEARLKTSNGAIHVNGSDGLLEAITSNGSVEVERHHGDVVADTSNGHIQVETEGGRLQADTSNSSIEARLKNPNPGEPVKLDTSNGHIVLTLDAMKLPEVKADTSNSSIELRLPASANAQIHASTSSSSITSDFEMTLPGGTHSKNRLDGKIGSGGPEMNLDTSNGSIKIVKEM